MIKDRRLILIFAIVFTDVIAANGLGALQINYVTDLPAKAVWLTGGTALMLGIQLALSPAVGHWSDKIGRRPVAVGAAIASLLSSFLLLPVQAWGYVANRVSKGGTNGLYAVMRSSVFATALANTLLSGVNMIAPFIFCAVSSVLVVWWAMRLPDEAKKYSDRIEAEQPEKDEQPQEAGA